MPTTRHSYENQGSDDSTSIIKTSASATSTTNDKSASSTTSSDYAAVSIVASKGQSYVKSLSPTAFVVLMVVAIIGAIAILFWIYWFCITKNSRKHRQEISFFNRKKDAKTEESKDKQESA
ncbi:uncharacterized protein I303_107038 [Kwoniella dejecticola CBS 10117]|uniref:Uncharacterized protein n=1 Tax=Kwoniella dejecticola CBS 10117 TaxID=1296121 RepID=A0A1A5ZYJ7_9TREE|nr:uncharacterized protein I303_06439 [Kwoniella dejecticola CBS 10117]OBR82882.1 hypothetical protein I303_06439 [Kwoniella dejecticola CBS 10117]